MTVNWLEEKDERIIKSTSEYLSSSRINRYFTCAESYRLYDIEGLRLRIPKANRVFGQLIHLALSHLFNKKAEPAKFFLEVWDGLEKIQLTYGQKESWDRFKKTGEGLLIKFVTEELPRIKAIKAVEKTFSLNISSMDLPLVGVIDLVAAVDKQDTIVDFKTADKSYGPADIVVSDQLTTYKLTEPEVEDLALCVFVKTAEPKIEWHPTNAIPCD